MRVVANSEHGDWAKPTIRTRPNPVCLLCGSQGAVLYGQMVDARFQVLGQWTVKRCLNPRCRLLWLDPQPHEEDLLLAYETYPTHVTGLSTVEPKPLTGLWLFLDRVNRYINAGYIAGRWGYDPFRTNRIQKLVGTLGYLRLFSRTTLDRSIMFLPSNPGGRLLEIGCGSGWMLHTLQNGGWTVTGIDFDPAAVASARTLGVKDVSANSLENCEYPDNTFDAVVMSHVIEHLYDPEGTLRECARILKPNGTIIVATPNTCSLGHRIFRQSWIHIHPPQHLYLFRPELLQEMAQRCGFSEIKVFTGLSWAEFAYAGSLAIRRTGRSGEPNIRSRRWARFLARAVRMGLIIAPRLGEECVLAATVK